MVRSVPETLKALLGRQTTPDRVPGVPCGAVEPRARSGRPVRLCGRAVVGEAGDGLGCKEAHGFSRILLGNLVEIDLQGGAVEPAHRVRIGGYLLLDVVWVTHPDGAAVQQGGEAGLSSSAVQACRCGCCSRGSHPTRSRHPSRSPVPPPPPTIGNKRQCWAARFGMPPHGPGGRTCESPRAIRPWRGCPASRQASRYTSMPSRICGPAKGTSIRL